MQSYTELDGISKLELGFRVERTAESAPKLDAKFGEYEIVQWAKTKTRPEGAEFYSIPTMVDGDDRVWVPDNVIDAFTTFGGHLMVKLVTPLPREHYSAMAIYKKLISFDLLQPQRPNGDWVYSFPIHGLENAGEGRKFFFVIHIDLVDETRAALTVHRIDVTRGKGHFTIGPTRKFGTFPPTDPKYIPTVAERFEIPQGKESFKPLRDLPLQEAVKAYTSRL